MLLARLRQGVNQAQHGARLRSLLEYINTQPFAAVHGAHVAQEFAAGGLFYLVRPFLKGRLCRRVVENFVRFVADFLAEGDIDQTSSFLDFAYRNEEFKGGASITTSSF